MKLYHKYLTPMLISCMWIVDAILTGISDKGYALLGAGFGGLIIIGLFKGYELFQQKLMEQNNGT